MSSREEDPLLTLFEVALFTLKLLRKLEALSDGMSSRIRQAQTIEAPRLRFGLQKTGGIRGFSKELIDWYPKERNFKTDASG